MEISRSLEPALAVISGGLGDIGFAIAQCLIDCGVDVAISDLAGESEADQILAKLRQSGKPVFYAPLNVTDFAATENWYGQVKSFFERPPNIIVVNAARVTLKKHFELGPAEWENEIGTNLTGAYYFSRVGAECLLKEKQAGRIVFLGSWAAHAPHSQMPAYSVAKAGLRMLNQTLALELAPSDILVNELAPGYVDGGLSGKIFHENPALRNQAKMAVPTQRLISSAEVAQQVIFLCSDLAMHMTGTTLLQDGGLSLLRGPQR